MRDPTERERQHLHRIYMRSWIFPALCVFTLALPVQAQARKDPLNNQETDQVREYADRPQERLKLYLKFISQRTDSLQKLTADKRAANRPAQIHNLMEELTRILDELSDNLDAYGRQQADLRKPLKTLMDAAAHWPEILAAPPPDPAYDFARKTALAAADAVTTDARKLLQDQETYFSAHKEEKGQAHKQD